MIRRQMNEEIPFLVFPITFRFAGKIPAKPWSKQSLNACQKAKDKLDIQSSVNESNNS